MSPQSPDPLITALETLAQSSPDLKPAARLYQVILPLLRDTDLGVKPIAISEERAREKLALGIPLLRDEPLSLDPGAVRELLIRLTRSLDKLRKEARPIRDAVENNKIEIDALVPSVFADDREYVDAKARELKLDSALLWTLAQSAVKPAFQSWARQLGTSLGDTRWDRVDCYVCGAIATLGELQGNDQFRHLRCGRCGADWQVRRLVCVYCGNENNKTLRKLYADGMRQQMHAQVCDACKGYIKVINAFSPNPPEMLAVQDLATLHLDFIALKNGYARMAVKER